MTGFEQVIGNKQIIINMHHVLYFKRIFTKLNLAYVIMINSFILKSHKPFQVYPIRRDHINIDLYYQWIKFKI